MLQLIEAHIISIANRSCSPEGRYVDQCLQSAEFNDTLNEVMENRV